MKVTLLRPETLDNALEFIGHCAGICYTPTDILTINYNKLQKRKMNNTLSGSGYGR